MYTKAAFEQIFPDAVETDTFFVCLIEQVPYYGGPEEGGWWGEDSIVIAYKEFPSEDLANLAAKKVEELAQELTEESRRIYGDACLQEMEWLDNRGLDSDFLPEPDGHSSYYVLVTKEVPSNHFGPRFFE